MEQLIRKPTKENAILDLVLNIERLFSYKILKTLPCNSFPVGAMEMKNKPTVASSFRERKHEKKGSLLRESERAR